MKQKCFLMLLILPLILTGCTLSTGIDTLLSPPKLDARQEHIYEALIDHTGENISLKYPKSGKNLSAFIIEDIDGDNEDEAIVFYKKNVAKVADNPLRINILDTENSKWYSVYDHPADGNEIEQVEVTKLGDCDKISIIVGYSLINRNEKKISVYDYYDGKLQTCLGNVPYSVFETADFNGDGKSELITASVSNGLTSSSAALYYFYENDKYKCSEKTFNGTYVNYHNIENNSSEDSMVFLDCEAAGGEILTEVLAVDKQNNLFQVFSPDLEKRETMRAKAYLSRDIDNDGKIEIPVAEFCDGYDENSQNAVYFTSWYEINDKKLKFKCESYYSIIGEYVFMIPSQWYGKITAVNNAAENELSICNGNDPETAEEIFSVKTVSGSELSTISAKSEYTLLRSRGDRYFFLKINKENPLALTLEELMMKFKFE